MVRKFAVLPWSGRPGDGRPGPIPAAPGRSILWGRLRESGVSEDRPFLCFRRVALDYKFAGIGPLHELAVSSDWPFPRFVPVALDCESTGFALLH